jgi:RNA polymerase sigma factor (sigma-70 family)
VTDAELVAAARAGDTAAFATLVKRHRSRLQAVAGRLLREESEDLVQETLLRAFLGVSQLRDPGSFGAWLCGIAVNLAKMRLRRRALEARSAMQTAAGEAATDVELLELVRDAVGVLPPTQREVVLMHYVDDLSCDEIASLLGTSPGAVRVRLHRAREQLREQLAVLAPTPKSKEEKRMIELRLEDVVVRVAEDEPTELVAPQRIVLLKEAGGDRVLPIWVGSHEGDALAMHLTGHGTARPMTSDLMAALIRATGARVDRVAVTDLRGKVYFAMVAIAVDGRVEELDARPSDALNLAVRLGAPIFVADEVLQRESIADVATLLDDEVRKTGAELPPGRWQSLSAEMLASLYTMP